MKKMLFAALAAGVLSSSSWAIWVTGTIEGVYVYPTDVRIKVKQTVGGSTVYIRKIDTALSTDQQKAFIATALTAKAQGDTVIIGGDSSCPSGNNGQFCCLKVNP